MSRWLAIGLLVVSLFLLPSLVRNPYYINLSSQILIAAILAISLNLLVGYGKLMSFAHGALLGVSAYTVAVLTKAGFGYLSATMAAVAVTLVVTAIVAYFSLRATGVGFLMITLASGQILWGLAYRWVNLTDGENGLTVAGRPAPFGISLASPATFYLATLVIFCLCFLANAVLVASPIGVSLQGTRDQPRRMSALGYNVWLIRFIAILISGFWASVSGFLFIYFNQFVSPHVMSLSASAEALLMVIVGGAGTLFGPVIGALVLVIIKNVASAYIDQWNAVLGTIFIAIIVFMPDGLVPGLVRLARSTPVIGKLLIAPEPGATVGDA